MPATPRGRGPRPAPGRSSGEDRGAETGPHVRASSPAQLYGAAQARRARARQASAAGDPGPSRQAELFAAARARRARPSDGAAATERAARAPERAGNVWPRGLAPPAAPPRRSPAPERAPTRPAPPPAAEEKTPAAKPPAQKRAAPTASAPKASAPAASAPTAAAPQPAPPAPTEAPSQAEPLDERSAALPTLDAPGQPEAVPVRAAEPVAAPAERRRPPDAERRPRRERERFLRRHFGPPSAFGITVIAIAIAGLTGVAGAYVWANNDADRLRQSAPTAPSTIAPADLAPPPEPETTTTTRPDLAPDAIARTIGPAVWTVNTLDSGGQPVTGSALLVGSPGGQGLLVTSLAVVEASTRQPAPEIRVAGGGYNGTAALWTWDDGRDLALLTVGRSAQAPRWTDESTPLQVGDRIYAVGGGGKVAQGVVTGLPGSAVQHNVFIDDGLRGGPLVNAKGDVVAVASAAFTGGGTPTDTTFFGVPIRAVCGGVLRCGEAAVPPTTTPAGGATPGTQPR